MDGCPGMELAHCQEVTETDSRPRGRGGEAGNKILGLPVSKCSNPTGAKLWKACPPPTLCLAQAQVHMYPVYEHLIMPAQSTHTRSCIHNAGVSAKKALVCSQKIAIQAQKGKQNSSLCAQPLAVGYTFFILIGTFLTCTVVSGVY